MISVPHLVRSLPSKSGSSAQVQIFSPRYWIFYISLTIFHGFQYHAVPFKHHLLDGCLSVCLPINSSTHHHPKLWWEFNWTFIIAEIAILSYLEMIFSIISIFSCSLWTENTSRYAHCSFNIFKYCMQGSFLSTVSSSNQKAFHIILIIGNSITDFNYRP